MFGEFVSVVGMTSVCELP